MVNLLMVSLFMGSFVNGKFVNGASLVHGEFCSWGVLLTVTLFMVRPIMLSFVHNR